MDYFKENSLGKLFEKVGLNYTCELRQQASITNHFHWIHNEIGQPTKSDMVNTVLPKRLLSENTPLGNPFILLLDKVDDYYRGLLMEEGIGDLLVCRVWR